MKEDFEYFITNKNTLSFGINFTHHTISPGNVDIFDDASINTKSIQSRYGLENSAYISDDWHATNKLNFLYGLRLTEFSLLGPGTITTYDTNDAAISSTNYTSGQFVKTYLNPEPRFSMSYILDEQSSIKASYNRNTQNIHLLSNSTASSPTDLYIMSINNIKPGIADQAALGYFKNSKDNMYEFSTEIYYKWLQNQVDYKNGAQLLANQDVESQLVYGKGRAYGLEVFLKKKYGDFNGWIGYTLSKTENKFDAINNGNYFAATQDRIHDISVVGIYKWGKRWTLSGTFVYGTGNAVTYPNGKYIVGGLTTFYYPNRNADRLPPYSRLDLGATLEGKSHKRFHSSWTFGIFNAYNRKNPYTVSFENNPNDPTRTQAVETSLFGVVPSVTYNFTF